MRNLESMSDAELLRNGELNNFVDWLPDGNACKYLRSYSEMGVSGLRFRDFVVVTEETGFSDKLLELTPEEFAKEIELVFEETGIDTKRLVEIGRERRKILKKLNNQTIKDTEAGKHFLTEKKKELLNKSTAILDEVSIISLPVFREMVRRGYSFYDLAV